MVPKIMTSSESCCVLPRVGIALIHFEFLHHMHNALHFAIFFRIRKALRRLRADSGFVCEHLHHKRHYHCGTLQHQAELSCSSVTCRDSSQVNQNSHVRPGTLR